MSECKDKEKTSVETKVIYVKLSEILGKDRRESIYVHDDVDEYYCAECEARMDSYYKY